MRQVILNSGGAMVIRVPAPAAEPGAIVVRTRYSLISVGTEIASLLPPPALPQAPLIRLQGIGSLAGLYLGKALRNPRKAVHRVASIAAHQVRKRLPKRPPNSLSSVATAAWKSEHATSFSAQGQTLRLTTDTSPFLYQAVGAPFAIPKGHGIRVTLHGKLANGPICFGLLRATDGTWLSSHQLPTGHIDEELLIDALGCESAMAVFANAGAKHPVSLDLDVVEIATTTPKTDGPMNEMDQQGWAVGYSAVGEVVAVGAGVSEFAIGQLVACCGAGKANHADYISVRRNMASPVPQGCDPRWAATTTVGAIALQGVRRAQPALGERIAVLGLGLIGQMTVQILRAAGCFVIGFDLDPERVERAMALGMDSGASDLESFRQLIRQSTNGLGADRCLATAATKSSAVINTAMDVTRAKGTVVIVGDVGLNVERAQFYRKEIDLLMSTSYGAGRYDPRYEEDGIDYPPAYARWTINRNMTAYMELLTSGRVNVEALIDRIAPVTAAAEVYRELVEASPRPMGVLLQYPDAGEDAAQSVIRLRGHRKIQSGLANYVLVGVGAYGTSMLVPLMEQHRDCFFLRGVVSQDPVRGGNYARANNLEILASELAPVLDDPSIDLLVIASRHHLHADQVCRALLAGKHVFVEKPLAITWDDLDRVVRTYNGLEQRPLLMVGFNRRFSPAIRQLRSELDGRKAPLVMNYRLNGGYIPPDSWLQSSAGGGRNLGEACHMYDVFRSLTGAPIASIQAAGINPGNTAYLRNDNFCATLIYEDGSIGNLVYTALGPKSGMPKERLEVFCDGKAWIVDDYKALLRAGVDTPLWQSDKVDKGQETQMGLFAHALAQGGAPPIPFDQLIETTAVALHVEDLLAGREQDP